MPGEVRALVPTFRLVVAPAPFSCVRVERQVPVGASLALLLEPLGEALEARVLVGDRPVPRHWWPHVRPKAGAEVVVRVVPGKGGGKGILGFVFSVASFFVPVAPGPGFFGQTLFTIGKTAFTVGRLFQAGLGLLGSLFTSSVAPPPSPRLSAPAQDAPNFAITGTSNRANPFGAVPRIYGVHKVYPPFAAQPFTEIEGDKQYLNVLFDFGYGPLKLSRIRIGETPIEHFSGVEMEIREGWPGDPPITLYRDQVRQQSLGILVQAADGERIVESDDDADEIVLDFAFQQGLVEFDNQGTKQSRSVQVAVDYRPAGSQDPWSTDGVLVQATTNSTALTTVGSSANSISYRTDNKTAGQVNLTLGLFDCGSGVPQGYGLGGGWVNRKNKQYRISTRRVGETNWTQQEIIDACKVVNNNNAGTSWNLGSPGKTKVSKTIVVPNGEQVEIKVEVVDFRGNATSTAPDVQSISYSTRSGGTEVFSGATTSLAFRSLRIKPPARGRYEVRIRRLTGDTTDPKIRDRMTLTAFKTITYAAPVNVTGHALVALRIQASEQLNGVVQQFNAIAHALLPTWDGSQWTAPVETRNPAWAFADVLRGAANARPVADSRIDTAALLAWANDNDAAGREFNAVIDARSTVFETLRDIAAVGRASFNIRDGRYSVVQDKAQSVPVQHFTPRNSAGFRGTRLFIDQPHGLKVRFIDETADYAQAERIVYDDGYSAGNASKFEVLELFGVTNPDQAWRDGRYHLAVGRLRPETLELTVDIEHIVCTRGDLVRVSHDVPMIGTGFARIRSVTTDGNGDVTAITLDDEVTMEAGKSYTVRVRLADGTSLLQGVQTVAGTTTSLTFTAPVGGSPLPAPDDLVMFGGSGTETAEYIVQAIEPQPDLSATLTLLDAAPAVHQADTGTIPDWDPHLTLPPDPVQRRPATPVIEQVVSDESTLTVLADGTLMANIELSFRMPAGGDVPAERIQLQYRQAGEADWQVLPDLAPDATIARIGPVSEGAAYDIRLRAIGHLGQSSEWAQVTGHTVIGQSTPPPDVTHLFRQGDLLTWEYPSPPVDLAGFLLRGNAGIDTNWANAAPLHAGTITAPPFDISGLSGSGQRTILVKAVDRAGNESLDAAVLTLNLGDPLVENVLLTQDRHPVWSGTITGGQISGGTLQADAIPTSFWNSDGLTFWGATASDPFWRTQYQEMAYEFSFTPDPSTVPDGEITLAASVTASGWRLEYQEEPMSPFWSGDATTFWGVDGDGFWIPASGWRTWPGSLTPIQRAPYAFRVTTDGGAVQGVITSLTVTIDVPDIVERIDDAVIASGGTRLSLSRSYRAITNVNVTVQDDGGTALTAKVIDKDPVNGPLIKTYNGSGAAVAGTIDATIQGY